MLAWKFRYPGETDEPDRAEAEEALAVARNTYGGYRGPTAGKGAIMRSEGHELHARALLIRQLPARVQAVEIQNRVEHQEIAAFGFGAPERVVGKQHYVALA